MLNRACRVGGYDKKDYENILIAEEAMRLAKALGVSINCAINLIEKSTSAYSTKPVNVNLRVSAGLNLLHKNLVRR